MIIIAELRECADNCRMMALSTNNSKWLSLAERLMHRADWFECGESALNTNRGPLVSRGPATSPDVPMEPEKLLSREPRESDLVTA
jgi:hypothetical protein